jgi:Flp pilus assembly protein TadD
MAWTKSRKRPTRSPQPPAPQAASAEAPVQSWGQRELLAIGLLTAGVLLTYSSLYRCGFINLDDPVYVSDNRQVYTGLSWANFRWAWTATISGNWHPLTMLSLQLDGQLFGRRPLGYHLTNLGLHLANTLLLFVLLRRMTGAVWRSAVVAALFGVHPLHVESVAWVSERKDVLSSLFGLLALLAYAHYARKPAVGWYALVFVCLALSLLAKPMLVTLPALLLLLDYWPLRRWGFSARASAADAEPAGQPASATWLVLEKLPLLLLVGASSVVTVWAQGTAVRSLDLVPLPQRLGNAVTSYVGYLWQMLVPLNLAAFYPHPGANLQTADVVVAGLVLAGITTLVVVLGRRWGYLPVGWFWYLGMLVPVIGLVQVSYQARADRYTYLPLVGVFVMLTWGAADLVRRWHADRPAAVVAGAVLAALVVLGWIQVGYWENSVVLWQHAFDVTEENWTTDNQLAIALRDQGEVLMACEFLEKAVKLEPKKPHLHANLGLVLLMLAKAEEAAARFQRDAGYHQDAAAIADRAAEHYEEAVRSLQNALDRDPNAPPGVHFNLAAALEALARIEEAAARSSQAAGRPQEVAALSAKATEHFRQAADHCRDALKADPNIKSAQKLLDSLSRKGVGR